MPEENKESAVSWPTLKNPPIREAVFDLRLGSNSLSVEQARELTALLQTKYTIINNIYLVEMNASIKENNPSSRKSISGFRLSDSTRAYVLQLQTDGITLSKVRPYISWNELHKEAKEVLEIIARKFTNLKFTRAALRYINQFDIQLELALMDYIKILPSFPTTLPRKLDAFEIRLQLPKKEMNAIIQMKINQVPNVTNRVRIYFDIDVFRMQNYSISNLDMLFSNFNEIRDYKNEIFFSSVTAKTLSQFE